MKQVVRQTYFGICAGIILQFALCGYPLTLNADPVATLNPKQGTWSEVIVENPAVAGSIVVGYVAGTLSATPDFQRLDVYLPSNPISSLCLEVRSIDGSYVATAEYALPQPLSAGLYRLTYPSQSDYFSDKSLKDVAILVTDALRCRRSDGDVAYLAHISPDDESPIYVYINSGTATQLRVNLISNSQSFDTDCTAYNGRRAAVNYNNICKLPVPPRAISEPACDNNARLVVRRKKFSTSLKPDFSMNVCR